VYTSYTTVGPSPRLDSPRRNGERNVAVPRTARMRGAHGYDLEHGVIGRRDSSKRGTVKAVSPCAPTVDHPLSNQGRPTGSHGLDLHSQAGRDVTRSVRTGAKLRHGTQVLALLGRHPIEPNEEEVAIELVDHTRPGSAHVIESDR